MAQTQAANHPRNDKNNNQIWISSNKTVNFYTDLAMKMFVQHETIELHGLGNAIEPSIEVAELLTNNKRATMTKLNTNTVDASGNNAGFANKPELLIVLKRTGIPQLPQNTDDE